MSFFSWNIIYRGREDQAEGGWKQVSFILADSETGVQGGGEAGAVPRPGHSTGQTDSQHRHHDGHLRVDCLHAQKHLLRELDHVEEEQDLSHG